MQKPAIYSNRTFAELAVGESASSRQTLSQREADLMAVLAGDSHVLTGWIGILLSRLIETRLPGPGTVPLELDLRLTKKVLPGMTVEVVATVLAKKEPDQVTLDCRIRDTGGEELAAARLLVRAPAEKVSVCCEALPDVWVNQHARHAELVARCRGMRPLVTAVVHPCDGPSLSAALEAAEAGLIEPILIGPRQKIAAAAAAQGLGIDRFRLVDAPHSHAAAAQAVAMGRAREVEALMKGSLHTDELMHAVLQGGLQTDRRISHVYLFDVPGQNRPLFITDAAINIAPDLQAKRDICRNAIELAQALGVPQPKVALLSAVETVNSAIPSTVDAAALCKMAERGQISGGVLDGPLAFDNAVSPEAARLKGIRSPVAGQADILVVPDLEAGNMLAKQLTYFNGADGAGIVLGAQLPIILASRADPPRTRIASCAIALLLARTAGKAAAP